MKTCGGGGGEVRGGDWLSFSFLNIEKKCPEDGEKKNVDEIFIKVPKFHETSPALKNFWLRTCLVKKKWGANRRKRFYSETWGSTVWRRVEGGGAL